MPIHVKIHISAMYNIILLVLLMLMNLGGIFAQRNISFRQLSIEEGLSQSTILSIASDEHGFMWFGTLDGLNKYDGYDITVYRNSSDDDKSIADNAINCIFSDRNGNLWFGIRKKGFARYDAVNQGFINYKVKGDSINEFIANNVNTVCDGRKNELLIGTTGGLFSFDKKKETFKQYDFNKISVLPLSVVEVTKLLNYRDSLVFIASDKGFFTINLANDSIRWINSLYCPGFIENSVNDIYIDTKDSLWIGTERGLLSISVAQLDYSNEKLAFTSFRHKRSDKMSISSDYITSITEDNEGYMWFGTRDAGLNKFYPRNKIFIRYQSKASDATSLSVDEVLSVYCDKSGVVWVGTSLGGINMYHKAMRKFDMYTSNPYDKNSLSAKQVRCIYQDKNKKIWIGTETGGLNLWNRREGGFTHFLRDDDNENTISNNHVRAIIEDSKNRFWIGTDGGGLNLFDRETGTVLKSYQYEANANNTISSNRIWRITEDFEGKLWIATFGGGLNCFTPENEHFEVYKNNPANETSLSDNNVTTVFEDRDKQLWIGTYNGGLQYFDRATKTFHKVQKIDDELKIDRIYSIIQDKEGFLWLGTRGSLQKLNPKTKEIIKYPFEEYGFPNHVMMGLAEDKSGNIWVTTNNGISCFNTATKTIRNYESSDGLQSNEFMIGAYYTTNTGEIIFGGVNGFNIFNPENIVDNPHIPEVVFTNLQILNQIVKLDTSIIEKKFLKLPYNRNALSFEFVVLDYVNPQKNKSKCFMHNFDTDWISLNKRRYASYTLPPGDYMFQILGSNNDKKWNKEGVSVSIRITPPFWKEYWFIAIMIALLSVIVYMIIHYRDVHRDRNQLEKIVQQRTAKIMQQNEEIKAQRDEIEKQRDLAEFQKQEITDSISYARRIQAAVLPPNEYIDKILPENFIFFKPRDIVSGDFYWLKNVKTKKQQPPDELTIVVAADCTGHGVPGAFMSMLGVSFLNEIVNKENILQANEILNALREKLIESLHQTGNIDEPMDGMDMALFIIHKNSRKLQFAGAYNPLYLIRQQTKTNENVYCLEQIKADRMPIGVHPKKKPFTNHIIDIKKGDLLYTFSDGYIDQFGGRSEKKFLTKRFQQLLLNICHAPMPEQKQLLAKNLSAWQGNYPQIDDILVIGIKV